MKAYSDEPSKYAQKTSKKVIATAFLFERGQEQRKHAIYWEGNALYWLGRCKNVCNFSTVNSGSFINAPIVKMERRVGVLIPRNGSMKYNE